ncbi:hypothetical protein GM418_31190 [Maribellus comscasis]|uniref:Pectate lyase superfamily protein domain-containing protein n=1 Tax=Maribellus comscasis TaxID=2681766 RepID=A0A6I6JZD6_9BACT|nr:hypothetical protein [Maribellus comscasis]QGY47961.1 hypothetical protein GM418_31190 [Maribellus comscasis]
MKNLYILLILIGLGISAQPQTKGFTNAADFGFSPDASGIENVKALQKAVDQTGTIIVSQPGTYKVAGTTYIGSNTTLEFGNGVVLKKIDEVGKFSHVILNKGALTRTFDKHIIVKGLAVSVNGVDLVFNEVFGLRGQIAFFYVKDLKIEGFRCYDLATMQFGIQVCAFEDLIIDDTVIKGKKDGIHLGRGNRFTISNAVLETVDDAIALNAQDYATSNPELGWIENGTIENCYDLSGNQRLVGYFCRILAGGWIDWKKGMTVQNADAVVSKGWIYRVDGIGSDGKPDGKTYISATRPTHKKGMEKLDGIKWVMVQEGNEHTAGVRNVTFRDIYLEKPRTGFSLHFSNTMWNRSYYPGAEIPIQKQLVFDNIRVLHEGKGFMNIVSPVDAITICNSSLKNGGINSYSNNAMSEYPPTKINIFGTVFNASNQMMLLRNEASNKIISLKTSNNVEISDAFKAKVVSEKVKIKIDSDLSGLAKDK